MPLSASSAVTLRNVIDQSLAPPPAAALAGGAGPANFCTIWPEVKPILQPLLAFFPGAANTAGPILTSLISVVDSIYQQTCPAAGGAAPAIAQNEVRALIEGSLGSASAPLGGAGPSANFCTIWPEAKPILQVLAGFASFIPIPGVGAAAGPVLASLIAVGDSVFQQTCHGS